MLRFLLPILFLLYSCTETTEKKKPTSKVEVEGHDYAFYVAGHVYGNPDNHQYGLYPAFKKQLDFISEYPKLEFGVFTGDVVAKPEALYWKAFLSDMAYLKKPYFLAPGNHGRGKEYEKHFKNYYSARMKHGDLIITLSPTNWNIEGEQLHFLKSTLEDNGQIARNIFIFVHELIWWSPEGDYSDIKINYVPHYPGSSNFWSTIEPLLEACSKPIYIFAGDLGASNVVDAFSYDKYKNIHLIGSGMGGAVDDNFLIVKVKKDGQVEIDKMGIGTEDPILRETIKD